MSVFPIYVSGGLYAGDDLYPRNDNPEENTMEATKQITRTCSWQKPESGSVDGCTNEATMYGIDDDSPVFTCDAHADELPLDLMSIPPDVECVLCNDNGCPHCPDFCATCRTEIAVTGLCACDAPVCEFEMSDPGPHPGCAEFDPDPGMISCDEIATRLVYDLPGPFNSGAIPTRMCDAHARLVVEMTNVGVHVEPALDDEPNFEQYCEHDSDAAKGRGRSSCGICDGIETQEATLPPDRCACPNGVHLSRKWWSCPIDSDDVTPMGEVDELHEAAARVADAVLDQRAIVVCANTLSSDDDHGPGCDGPLNCTCEPAPGQRVVFTRTGNHGTVLRTFMRTAPFVGDLAGEWASVRFDDGLEAECRVVDLSLAEPHSFQIGDAVTCDGSFAWIVIGLDAAAPNDVEISTPAGHRQIVAADRLSFVERPHSLDVTAHRDELPLSRTDLYALLSLLRRAVNDDSIDDVGAVGALVQSKNVVRSLLDERAT